uniref:Uncharacterized protein n=1 Tax=Arundo donax TaxID=35708 RepID=A0A0A9DR71_ARUDO
MSIKFYLIGRYMLFLRPIFRMVLLLHLPGSTMTKNGKVRVTRTSRNQPRMEVSVAGVV